MSDVIELLPPNPDKDGSYWLTDRPDDPKHDRVFEWLADARAWRDDWRYDDDQLVSPGKAYADGYRLAWPHPIPTAGELKALHQLVIGMREEADARRQIGDHYSAGAAVGFMWAERRICQILGWGMDDAP